MLSKNVLYYGTPDPLPEQISLRAGPLTMRYENGDLRYIRLGSIEIVRRIYVAVRDRNWGTLPPRLSNLQMDIEVDSFKITYEVENQDQTQGIDFCWRGTIRGEADGALTFAMAGVARSTFLRNRLGFCVLHPIRECAGQPCTMTHSDGAVERSAFPDRIAPTLPFRDMRALTYAVQPGLRATLRFEGDIFETEDQRNWIDASYKTFCTPLHLPYPVEVQRGTQIAQSIGLTWNTPPTVPPISDTHTDRVVTLSVNVAQNPLPTLGLGMASHGQPLSDQAIVRLRALRLAHLRVDLRLAEPDWAARLRAACAEAARLDVALEIALFVSDAAARELAALRATLDSLERQARIARWLIFHVAEKTTSAPWIELARATIGGLQSDAIIGGGTNVYFNELNNHRPETAPLDCVTYSINPQIHAFDNASLAETIEAIPATVATARSFCGDRPLIVSPIVLKPRFNAVATGPEPAPTPGELPPQVDPRQMSLFGAGWTLGCLAALANGSVDSVTLYETSGWRGVLETEAGSSLPERFRSIAGAVFPLYHVLADVGDFVGDVCQDVPSSDPLSVVGLLLTDATRTRVLVANLSSDPLSVILPALGRAATVRIIDESNAERAMVAPEAFRAQVGEDVAIADERIVARLNPYALARIDFSN